MMALYDESTGSVGYSTKKYVQVLPKLDEDVDAFRLSEVAQADLPCDRGRERELVRALFCADRGRRTPTTEQTLTINDPRSGYVHQFGRPTTSSEALR